MTGHDLVFCHQYPTQTCGWSNLAVRSSGDNVASPVQGGNSIERSGCDCQHQGGRELGLNGMVNKCELPLNVVTTNKPKMLTGLNQKVRGRVSVLQNHRPQMQAPPAERQDLTHSGIPAERGKPVSLP
jgi:hypothetical protein